MEEAGRGFMHRINWTPAQAKINFSVVRIGPLESMILGDVGEIGDAE